MSLLNIGPQGADVNVINTSSTKSQDALTFDLVVNGQRRYFWVPMGLPGGSQASVTARFLTSVDAPVIALCGDRPVGIIDNPDPVVAVSVKQIPTQ